jgi:Amidohydrolase
MFANPPTTDDIGLPVVQDGLDRAPRRERSSRFQKALERRHHEQPTINRSRVEPRPVGGAQEVRAEFAKIYYDLALSANPIAFNALKQITTVDHITFGTDYPFSGSLGLDLDIQSFESIKSALPQDDQRKIEFGNASTCFRDFAALWPARRPTQPPI